MKNIKTIGKVGRKKGHKLSEESKNKIAASKTGQLHTEEEKKKISDSMKNYWKNITPAEKALLKTKGRRKKEVI